jgi:hypothetical protein
MRVSRWTGSGKAGNRVGGNKRVLETRGGHVTARAGVEKFQTCCKRTGRVMQ